MKKAFNLFTKFSFVILVLIILAGCNPFADTKKDTNEIQPVKKEVKGTVLLRINGEPTLTEDDFNKHLAQMLQVNPYFKDMGVDMLPAPLKKKFFDELIKQEVIVFSQKKNKVDKEKDFIESFNQMKELVERSLLIQKFEKGIVENIQISDREVRNHFNDNKEKFIKEPGGVLISAVKFEDKVVAAIFYNKVKNQSDKFVELAESEKKGEFKDFGRVSKVQRGFDLNSVPSVIKKKAFDLNNIPVVEKMDVGKKFWVVYFSDKQDSKYFDFDEVKQQLEAMLKNNKFREALDKEVDKIRGNFTLKINEEYFKEAEPVAEDVEEMEIQKASSTSA